MATVWRITPTKFVKVALTGEGASIYGGRWNSKGNKAVYSSATLSLAILETLVHFEDIKFPNRNYTVLRLDIPDQSIVFAPEDSLPELWNDLTKITESARYGDKWLVGLESVALAVPSVVVPSELNYIINPSHIDFTHVKIEESVSLKIDARLLAPGSQPVFL